MAQTHSFGETQPPNLAGEHVNITLLQTKLSKYTVALLSRLRSGAMIEMGAEQLSSGPRDIAVPAMESMERNALSHSVFQVERHVLAVPDEDACHRPPALAVAGSVIASSSSSSV